MLKDTRKTSHIARIMSSVRNGEKFKMHKIYWIEGSLQLAKIATNNVGEHNLTPIMKYIMVRFDNQNKKIVLDG